MGKVSSHLPIAKFGKNHEWWQILQNTYIVKLNLYSTNKDCRFFLADKNLCNKNFIWFNSKMRLFHWKIISAKYPPKSPDFIKTFFDCTLFAFGSPLNSWTVCKIALKSNFIQFLLVAENTIIWLVWFTAPPETFPFKIK